MIGSLQEFIGVIDKDAFLVERKKRTLTLRPRSRTRNGPTDLTADCSRSHVSSIKYAEAREVASTREKKSIAKESGRGRELNKSSRTNRWAEHVPDSKREIFKAFAKLGRTEELQRHSKMMDKLREGEGSEPRKPKQVSYMHLKGHLKHDHQLLRSIVRVEEQALLNPKTFLELSLESLTQSMNQIKVKPALQANNPNLSATIEERDLNSVEKLNILNTEAFPEAFKRSKEIQSNTVHSSHRILLENAHRWARSRAKSTKSYENTLGISQKREEEESQKRLKQDRKEVLKKIGELLTPQRFRKNSLRKSSLRVSSRFFL